MGSEWTAISASPKMSEMLWREAMRRKRRNHSPEFKAKVALAAIQGDLTMAQLVEKFDRRQERLGIALCALAGR